MLLQIKDVAAVASAERAIRELLGVHAEWFFVQDGGAPLSLANTEFDFSIAHRRLIFTSWTETGSRSWRITAWEWNGEKLLLAASRRMGADVATLELVPRASAKAIVASIAAARQARCEKLAQIDARNVDSLLSSALLWFNRVRQSPKRPFIERLSMIVERPILEAARQRHVLLRDELRQRIELHEIRGSSPTRGPQPGSPAGVGAVREGLRLNADESREQLEPVRPIARKHLWRRRLARFPPVTEPETTERAQEIIACAPHAIDVVAARHGQTLRYYGLPFARLRRVLDRDRVWFGIEGSRRRLLDEYYREDWKKLLLDLEEHRNPNASDRRHWLYRAAGEAWLESILRRDISKLDPGLIVAPLHAQFRTSHGGAFGASGARPIDLLALRHDGRLAVIELKVSEDREHVFQGVDYWRRVEAHRRRGHISSAKLFGDRKIKK